jgi:pilus assembly protein Flp/PilA
MQRFALLCKFVRDESGQDLMEYGMLAALIAVVLIGALTKSGLSIAGFWAGISTSLATVA